LTQARKLKLIIYCLALAGSIIYWIKVTFHTPLEIKQIPIQIDTVEKDTSKLINAVTFCDSMKYNKEFVILIDLSGYSGSYRLFAVNLITNDTLLKGLVTHGHCKRSEGRIANFSNEIESNCSAIGRYYIGQKYNGRFGITYKMHGLDLTNSNAFGRFIVLHSHSCVPDNEQEDDICESEGCPTVSPRTLAQLSKHLDASLLPVLVWIYAS
jgi:hypothetical protein